MALQTSRILYTFVLRAKICTTFESKVVRISERKKNAKFAGVYFPHFTTFRDQTFEFY